MKGYNTNFEIIFYETKLSKKIQLKIYLRKITYI